MRITAVKSGGSPQIDVEIRRNASALAICFSVARFIREHHAQPFFDALVLIKSGLQVVLVMRPAWMRHSPIFLRNQNHPNWWDQKRRQPKVRLAVNTLFPLV